MMAIYSVSSSIESGFDEVTSKQPAGRGLAWRLEWQHKQVRRMRRLKLARELAAYK